MGYSSQELAHYGVKGMRWGVTRADISTAGQKAKSTAVTVGRATGKAAVVVGKKTKQAAIWAAHHKKVVVGALIAADILRSVAVVGVGYGKAGILMKAAANRKAAYEAGKIAARSISASASKIPYAKISRGAYKITTMK